jgi:hypothetical protein
MTQREIVVEYERIQLIRKRAKTRVGHCPGCGHSSDFVSLDNAAQLFEVERDVLVTFIDRHLSHAHSVNNSETEICIAELLRNARALNGGTNIGRIEE